MSVGPASLLQLTPEVNSTSFAQAKQASARSDGEADFHKVYAQERDAKPAERNEPAAKTTRERKTDARRDSDKTDKQDAKADNASKVADSGNDLPADEPVTASMAGDEDSDDATELDPMALMDLLNQPVVANNPPPTPTVPDNATPTNGAELLAGLSLVPQTVTSQPDTTAVQTSPSDDADDALAALALPGMASDAKSQAGSAAKTEAGKGKPVDATSTTTGQDFTVAMQSMGEQFALDGQAAGDTDSLDDKLADFDLTGAEGKEGGTATESFADRMQALGQGLSPSVAAQRGSLVPGQPVAVSGSGFSEAVVDRVMWMSSQNLKSAEIQLDPANLGRLEVRVHLDQDQTQVTFSSPNQAVRDTLESQMHRLRDMFSQQGMNLADVNVSDQSLSRGWQGQQAGSEGQSRGGSSAGGRGLSGDEDDDLAVGAVQVSTTALDNGRGLVDYYA